MIIDGATSLLVVAIDAVPSELQGQVDYLSLSSASAPEAEQMATQDLFDQFIRSDANRLVNRIPIPINDELLPIVQMGADSRMSSNVQKLTVEAASGQAQQAVYTPSRDTLSLTFRMLSKMGTISSIADIVNALGKISAVMPVYCSWFSRTDCIFNARLVGIARSSEKNSDMEALTLNLERAPNKAQAPKPPEATPSVLKKVTAPPTVPTVRLEGYAEAAAADLRDGWVYYDLGSVDELIKQAVPYVEAPFTVQRQPVEIYLVRTTNKGGRDIQGVNWVGQYATIDQATPFIYTGGLALLRFAGRLFMGVPE